MQNRKKEGIQDIESTYIWVYLQVKLTTPDVEDSRRHKRFGWGFFMETGECKASPVKAGHALVGTQVISDSFLYHVL